MGRDTHTHTQILKREQINGNVRVDRAVGTGGLGGGKKHKRLIYFRPGNPSRTHNVSYATCVFTCHHDTGGEKKTAARKENRSQKSMELY